MEENKVEETVQPSRKRELAATAAAATVTVAITVAANVITAVLSQKVHNRISPKADTK